MPRQTYYVNATNDRALGKAEALYNSSEWQVVYFDKCKYVNVTSLRFRVQIISGGARAATLRRAKFDDDRVFRWFREAMSAMYGPYLMELLQSIQLSGRIDGIAEVKDRFDKLFELPIDVEDRE